MIRPGEKIPPGLIMNQKFIARFCLAAALLCGPVLVSAYAAPVQADADQNSGQTITVRGTVYDDQGAPLPGAGVMVKGTTQGAITDLDGNYEIRVKPNQTLVFSFVGMKDQEIAVDGRTRINAALDSQATTLDDVVVVGYGTIKKANLTGAVDVVNSKTFENRVTANVDQMLKGNVPSVGIAITDGAPYRRAYGYQIRGDFQTLASSSAAGDYEGCLVLIDGTEGDPTLINPNDIESVSILKDAAASAIYGSRGAYGVILITTKNPDKADRVTVSYSGNFNVGVPTAMPDLLLDGELYSQIRDEAYFNYNGKHANNFSNWQPYAVDPRDVGEAYKSGKQGVVIGDNGAYSYYGATDWFKEIYKKQVTSQIHNLSITGNNGKTSYLISGRLYDYNGLYVGKSDPYNTYNLRSKVNTQVFPWLRLGQNFEFTYDKVNMGIASKGDALATPQMQVKSYGAPTWSVYNPDGTFTKAGALILGGLIGDAANRNSKTKETQSFRSISTATASFFDNTLRFNADFSYRYKFIDVIQKAVAPFYSITEGVSRPHLDESELFEQYAKEQFKNQNGIQTNVTAEYENTFGKHWLKAMVGYNYEKRNYRSGEYKKKGLSYEDALGENPFAFASGTDGDGAMASNGEPRYTYWVHDIGKKGKDDNWSEYVFENYMISNPDNFEVKHWRNAGTFFRLNYSYDERYLLEVNGRYDGSSVFSKGYQWGFFPSVSAAWRPTQEHWWHLDPRFISALKFRVSYGELGDCMSAGAYNAEDTFDRKTISNRVINGSSSTTYLAIPDETNMAYTWSTVRTFDAGMDASFFSNRLDITADYFIRRNLNMLTVGPAHAATYGSPSAKGNYADMSTYGWEVDAHYNDQFMLGGKPFHFGARFAIGNNFTIVDRFEGNEQLSIKANNYRAGERLGEIWGFKSNGLFQDEKEIETAFDGKPFVNKVKDLRQNSDYSTQVGDIWILDLNGNGEVDTSDYLDPETGLAGDKTILGNRMPRLPYSFGFDFAWNNFFFNIGFQGVMHQDQFIGGGMLAFNPYGANNGPMTKWFTQNYWTPDRPDALLPRLSKNSFLSSSTQTQWNVKFNKYPVDRFMFDVGYLNLQSLQFGYNLPKKLIQKLSMNEFKIFFSGENLWNWSPFYKTFGRDYDVTTIAYGGDDYEYGMDWWGAQGGYQYPKLRTFSLGINIVFAGAAREIAKASGNGNAELANALAAANAAAEAANAAAAKAKAEADALRDELAKALKDKEDCEAAKKPMAVRRAEALHLEDIYFEINQSVIRDSEAYKVDNLVKVLKANPEAHVSITGYADQATGTELRNLVLTKERAEVVANALKAAGIGPDRIRTEFYGTEKDSSFTPENNRLAVCIVNK